MGNNKSKQTKKLHESRKQETGQDSDDDEDILEIDQQFENAEFLVDRSCSKCETLYGAELIPIKELSLDTLPDALRDTQVLDFILSQAKLVVKLENRCFASGWACVSEEQAIEYSSCPLQNCPVNEGHPHKAYGGITVYTNKHVVTSKAEAEKFKVSFFYDDENANSPPTDILSEATASSENLIAQPSCDGQNGAENFNNKSMERGTEVHTKGDCPNLLDKAKAVNDICDKTKTISSSTFADFEPASLNCTARGFYLKQVKDNKDLVAMETIYHDPRLFQIVAACSRQRLTAWASMPNALKKSLKDNVIVISHPHGRSKMVSVGKLICLEIMRVGEEHVRETRYSAATCLGSSGAPVLSGHYPYRPFTHSSKRPAGNFSLSY
ncbi:hypothetical protein PoB_003793500 [Plakobranchus ocellatus]|uniref:Peptidase S1 domain-containing protein n=1 Tax=Plakobranchus ocellatus TaxID=259542 RepID=A0AAV4AX72_9GAST|nr:hypothetical protein PoB_003793500 [Plakobranchus ocellatus]